MCLYTDIGNYKMTGTSTGGSPGRSGILPSIFILDASTASARAAAAKKDTARQLGASNAAETRRIPAASGSPVTPRRRHLMDRVAALETTASALATENAALKENLDVLVSRPDGLGRKLHSDAMSWIPSAHVTAEIRESKAFGTSGDGTTIRHLKFEAKLVTYLKHGEDTSYIKQMPRITMHLFAHLIHPIFGLAFRTTFPALAPSSLSLLVR
ncbi:hypothetical protein B0H14DRAFT_2561827 [Mycena olivaceomarginata]|nr:hypothetical protein B0H14DRAFT_2561827 [Mycena olivaceomarginata]